MLILLISIHLFFYIDTPQVTNLLSKLISRSASDVGLSPDAGNKPFNHYMQRNDIINDVLLCSSVSCLLHTNYHSYLSANASLLYYYHFITAGL